MSVNDLGEQLPSWHTLQLVNNQIIIINIANTNKWQQRSYIGQQ